MKMIAISAFTLMLAAGSLQAQAEENLTFNELDQLTQAAQSAGGISAEAFQASQDAFRASQESFQAEATTVIDYPISGSDDLLRVAQDAHGTRFKALLASRDAYRQAIHMSGEFVRSSFSTTDQRAQNQRLAYDIEYRESLRIAQNRCIQYGFSERNIPECIQREIYQMVQNEAFGPRIKEILPWIGFTPVDPFLVLTGQEIQVTLTEGLSPDYTRQIIAIVTSSVLSLLDNRVLIHKGSIVLGRIISKEKAGDSLQPMTLFPNDIIVEWNQIITNEGNVLTFRRESPGYLPAGTQGIIESTENMRLDNSEIIPTP